MVTVRVPLETGDVVVMGQLALAEASSILDLGEVDSGENSSFVGNEWGAGNGAGGGGGIGDVTQGAAAPSPRADFAGRW